MPLDTEYRIHDGTPDDASSLCERFCALLFPDLPPGFVRQRLPHVADPLLCIASRGTDIVGFKLAYRTTDTVLFSWLGGVRPEARRSGVADGLMRLQHAHARSIGYRQIETRTRTTNNGMIMLNLRHGFTIVGLEADAWGRLVAIQRTSLDEASDPDPATLTAPCPG